MHRLAIGLAACVWLVACTTSPADNAARFCQPACQCFEAPLPSLQRDCNAACVEEFVRDPLPELCVACVEEHADRCATLVDDCDADCSVAIERAFAFPDLTADPDLTLQSRTDR